MPISDFLLHPEHEVSLLVFRDVFVDEAALKSKFSKDFEAIAAIIKLDESDIKKFGLKEGSNVKLTSSSGSLVARVVKDAKQHEGIAFMPLSAWSNSLMSYDGKNPATMRLAKITIASTSMPVTGITSLI